MPGEVPGHRASHRTVLLPAAVLAVIAAAALGGLAWLFLSGGDSSARLLNIDPDSGHPLRVAIREPAPGTRIPASDPLTIVVETLGAAKVERYELWADGALALRQSRSSGPLPGRSRLAWRPGAPGPHVLIARAFDTSGRMGRSEPVVVEAVASPDDGMIGVTVEAQPGDTVATIAASIGVAAGAGRVPGAGGEPQPGQQLVVMVPGDRVPEGYVDDDGPAPDARAQPPPEPQGDAGDARPADDAAPDQLPWGFERPGDPDPPDAPTRLAAVHGAGCEVGLQWTDSSDSETGFRIYRLGSGGDFRPIRDLQANVALAELTYTDHVLFGGHYEYYVASVNSGGESDSNLAGVDVPEDGCTITTPGIAVDAAMMLQFEATSLRTDTQFDDAYCYLSLARLEPYARIPDHDDVFLAPTPGGGWNIDYWASGIARRVFMQPPREPVPVRMECWGSRGGEEPNLLGSFEASHPRDEWDGRDLIGEADGFRAVYHIGPYVPRMRAIAIEDNRIPAPSNVHIPDDRADCDAHADFGDGHEIDGLLALWACAEIADHLIVWDWTASPAFPRGEISGFRVRYQVIDDFAFGDADPAWHVLGDIGPYTQVFPIPMPSCDERFHFKVTAVIRPADGGEERESPASAVFPLERRGCPPPQVQVEVTLISVDVRDADDGVGLECLVWPLCIAVYDFTLEAYGNGGFNVLHRDGLSQVDYGTNFLFFTHDCGGNGLMFLTGCVGFNPLSVGARPEIDEAHIRFADEQMATCRNYRCSAFGTNQNTFTVTVQDGDSIEFWFNLRDDDDAADDTWCGTDEDYTFESEVDESIPVVIGPHSLEEWLNIFENVRWDNGANALDDQDANCTMHMFVDGSRIER
ncbi:MAG: hypothetical protein HY874_06720 [Chloroflexi bacterium]|nr:hypothetical protein [Chloroflexota bacterium]